MDSALPYDELTENAVLGCLIAYPDEYNKVSKYFIDPDVFYQKKAKLLWNRIKEMKHNGQYVDTLTVCTSITKKDINQGLTKHYIVCCATDDNKPLRSMTELYASKLYEKYLMRCIIIKADDIKVNASDNSKDIYTTISEAHSILSELLNLNPSKAADINKVIKDTLDGIKNKTTKLIKTGYKNVDKFAGGLTRGEITIIGGRPGHGKTTVMINMLANVLDDGKRAIFFSRELPNSELLKKIICLESQQLSYGMVRKNVFTETDLKVVNQTISHIKEKYSNDKFLMFDNLKDFSLSSGEVKKFKPDIIFDDYIQLIACNGKEEQRRLQIEKLVNDYKWLAKETNCVVVLASQLNRFIERANTRGKGFTPQLSDLAESGAIEQVAENVFFSYYDYKVQGEKGKGKNVIQLIAGKVRYGDSGSVDLGYDGDKCKIYNSIEEMVKYDEIPF